MSSLCLLKGKNMWICSITQWDWIWRICLQFDIVSVFIDGMTTEWRNWYGESGRERESGKEWKGDWKQRICTYTLMHDIWTVFPYAHKYAWNFLVRKIHHRINSILYTFTYQTHLRLYAKSRQTHFYPYQGIDDQSFNRKKKFNWICCWIKRM